MHRKNTPAHTMQDAQAEDRQYERGENKPRSSTHKRRRDRAAQRDAKHNQQ